MKRSIKSVVMSFIMKYSPKSLKRYITRRKLLKVYNTAVKHAEEMHQKDHTTVYVIVGQDAMPFLMTRETFRACKRKHLISESLTMMDLKEYAIYHTADKSECDAMDENERVYRMNDFVKYWLEQLNLA